MSTRDPQPTAFSTDGTVETGMSAMVLAAVFIVVEIVLMAETISVILLGGSEQRNPGAATIAILLSTALLTNLGLVCTFIAASAASAVRRSRRAEAVPVAIVAAVSCSAEAAESSDGCISPIGVIGLAADPGTAGSASMPASG